MFGEEHPDSIVQRGIAEALACQDMLERTPVKPAVIAQMVAWVVATARSLARHQVAREHRVTPAVPNVAVR